ncbi:hypothetical protein LCGC14_1239080 [marine sediment metagenome]|uniref:Uncharacterized protein n=1 Tax=marine sediment metagenome TaxID=412755 RepID=A0A0F9L6L3_9ZZZZ
MTRKYYLTEIDIIDYGFLGEDLETIQLEFLKPYPIIDTNIIMDIDTILKLQKTIEEMLKLRMEKKINRSKKNDKKKIKKENKKAGKGY